MSLYISDKAVTELSGLDSSQGINIEDVVSILQSIADGDIGNRSDVHKLKNDGEDIYVLKHRNLRLFFTKKDNDFVFLSVTSRNG